MTKLQFDTKCTFFYPVVNYNFSLKPTGFEYLENFSNYRNKVSNK